MALIDDLQFHIRRQEQELECAHNAVDEVVGALHLELAEEHARHGARARVDLELELGSVLFYPAPLASF